MMQNNEQGFKYTYSAQEQAEIKTIREKYLRNTDKTPKNKIEHLRQLDAGVTKKATVIAISMGIIFSLLMGGGMSLIMTEFGGQLGLSNAGIWVLGLLAGMIGLIGIMAVYPAYRLLVDRERQRIAPEILQLTEELTE